MTVRTMTIDQLCLSPFNARTDARSIGALTAMKKSLLKRGQIMPLIAHPMLGNKKLHGVFGGGRRYRSFKELIEEGKLAPDHPIDVVIREGLTEAELIELSVAENEVRRDLYAYETYAGLARAHKRGATLQDIAETLGQEVSWARKYVRLGMLPEVIFNEYAEGNLSFDVTKAFAATEDAQLQIQVYETFSKLPVGQRTANVVRSLMKVGDRELDRMLRFVGEDRYRAAGGRYELDLYAEEGEVRGRVTDEGLLRQLANDGLEKIRNRVRARAGKDLRFAVAPPQGEFGIDRSLEIKPPIAPLDPAEEKHLAQLRTEQDDLVETARLLVDEAGRPKPGTEAQIAALDEMDAKLDRAIAALEDRRPLVLPDGDIFATIDIEDNGDTEVRFWFTSRKAQAATMAPAPRPSPKAKASAPIGANPGEIAEGSAIANPSTSGDMKARGRADALAKVETGLTQEGVQLLRSLRRSILRAQLLEDMNAGGSVADDYFTWGQLRLLLTQATPASIGMQRFWSLDRDTEEAAELISATTMGAFELELEQLRGWPCFTNPDLQAAFLEYRGYNDLAKDTAATMLACLVLERSLNSDGYRIALHDTVAAETGVGEPAQIRELSAFTPTPPFFNLFSKDHRLELVTPFVSRAGIATWAKRRAPEISAQVAKVFTGASEELLEGTDAGAAAWVHPLLTFTPIEAPAGADRQLEKVAE